MDKGREIIKVKDVEKGDNQTIFHAESTADTLKQMREILQYNTYQGTNEDRTRYIKLLANVNFQKYENNTNNWNELESLTRGAEEKGGG